MPLSLDSEDYRKAYARLHNATYADLNRLNAEFQAWCEDNHKAVTHHYVNDQSLAVKGLRSKPSPTVNMKGIQRHGHKYRVQQRRRGQLRKWTYDTLKEAVAKRDTLFRIRFTLNGTGY